MCRVQVTYSDRKNKHRITLERRYHVYITVLSSIELVCFLIVCSSEFYTESLLIPEKSEGNTNLGTGPYCGFVFHDTLQSGS